MIQEPELYRKIIADLTSICSKFGKVTLVKPIEAHPEGVVIIRFDEPKAASIAIGELDGAEYHGKTVITEPWDGSDLSVRETHEDEEKRVKLFEEFLEQESK